jgi:hypothetical protein
MTQSTDKIPILHAFKFNLMGHRHCIGRYGVLKAKLTLEEGPSYMYLGGVIPEGQTISDWQDGKQWAFRQIYFLVFYWWRWCISPQAYLGVP